MTPSASVRRSTGSPSFSAARPRRASRAVAAASARFSELKLVGVDWLPDVVPWSGVIGCVALNQFYAGDRDAQLLRDQLGLSGKDALPEVALSGVRGDGAVGADGQPGIELLRIDVRGMRVELPLAVGRTE